MDKKELIKKAKDAYYNTGETIMSDAEYDALVAEVGEESVGAPVLDSVKKIKIEGKPMLSLNKCHSAEEITQFAKGHDLVASVKCDGLSVRLTYDGGKLISANTRGDGYIGQDITEHIKYFTNVPLTIGCQDKMVIDGEAIIYQHDFDEINKNGEFKNPRNLAAGTLASLDTSLCHSRRMSFIVWDLIEPRTEFYNESLLCLKDFGFTIVPYLFVETSANANIKNETLLKVAEELGIPCDGVVWKFNDLEYGDSLGQTEHHFKNGIAWKPARTEVETELLDIQYDVSRKGILTPVAVFKPVELLGSTVERATLHNLSVLEELLGEYPDLYQPITIYKANEIIPKVDRAAYKNNILHDHIIFDSQNVRCPICSTRAEIQISNNGIKNLICPNENCEGKLAQQIDHFVGKKGLDVKGLSRATIEKLIDWGFLQSKLDIFNLSTFEGEWKNKPGFGAKSVDNILSAIESSKHCLLENFISGLGISLVGSRVAKEIVKYYSTWNDFREAVGGKWSDIDGFGIEMERALNNYDYTEADKIAEILIFEESAAMGSSSVEGLNFVITGKLSRRRDDIVADIESCGGKVTGSVSGKTSYLVCNDKDSATGKSASAKKLGIPIITEQELMNLLGKTV